MNAIDSRLVAALADRYRIERELGQGGMATVYLAQDLKHGRKVAVKVLRPELAAVIGAERFLAEIKTTAHLQHPHILPLFDSGRTGGQAGGLGDQHLFYVMPFIDGESLRDRLTREKQLPIADAVGIATEVASALDYAHRHGVIHRDIKPENILLHDGQALVADFGIALAASNAGASRMTETGMSLGTPHYMSPEQAMGERTLDARTDVYALGCVTYEMLVGEPPFTGPTAQAIVAKVLSAGPARPTEARKAIPPQVEGAILIALEKLPADRFATAAAFAEALSGRPGTAGVARGAVTRPVPRRLLSVAHGIVTAVAIGAALWLARRGRQGGDQLPIRFVVDDGSAERFNVLSSQPVAISPDGRTIAYVGAGVDRRLYVRTLDELTPRALPETQNATTPFFSPDGRWIGYFTSGTVLSTGKLVKVPVDGGPVVELADGLRSVGGAWTPGGQIVVGSQERTGGLSAVPATGGSPVRIVDPIPGDPGIHRWPRLLPDGETVLFSSWNSRVGTARIGVASLRTHRARLLDIVGAIPLTVIDGYLLYMQATGTVMAVAFDQEGWVTHGEAIPVLEGASLDGVGGVRLAISTKGDLVYALGADERRLVLVDAQGKMTSLLAKPGAYANPRFSPDGRRIALDIATPTSDIWVYDRAGGTLDRITTTGESDRPEWMPDGRRIFFRVSQSGRSALFSTTVDGGGTADSLQAFKDDIHEGTIGPDGHTLLFRTLVAGGGRDIWSVRLGGGEPPRQVLATPFQELQPRLSRDGHWLAYVSDESGTLEIYVRPFPGDGGRVRVSTEGGTEPAWSPEGDRLFYRLERRMMVAHVTRTPMFAVSRRQIAFEGEFVAQAAHVNYDVGPGGREVVMVAPASGGSQLVMVRNWLTEVRARIAGPGTGR